MCVYIIFNEYIFNSLASEWITLGEHWKNPLHGAEIQFKLIVEWLKLATGASSKFSSVHARGSFFWNNAWTLGFNKCCTDLRGFLFYRWCAKLELVYRMSHIPHTIHRGDICNIKNHSHATYISHAHSPMSDFVLTNCSSKQDWCWEQLLHLEYWGLCCLQMLINEVSER